MPWFQSANCFREELLSEFDVAERQLLAIAEAIPADRYAWRPAHDARSVSEVLVHVAAGTFMLLELVGTRAPTDVYGDLPDTPERIAAFIAKNDDLERTVSDKLKVIELTRHSLRSVRESISKTDDASFERPLDPQTNVRRVYLRLLAHTHEHMGQMIAYARANGIAAPWPDWRPDRRAVESSWSPL